MNDSLGKFFTVLLAVLLLLIYPLQNMLSQQDFTTRAFVYSETTLFVDTVRNLGYITPELYEEYLQQLNATNLLYDIEMEHHHETIVPVYTDAADPLTFQDTYQTHFFVYYTEDIKEILYPTVPGAETVYYLTDGDYFIVTIKNKSKTLATKVKQALLGHVLPVETIVIRYGGMVK